jgi:penicillin G amidase
LWQMEFQVFAAGGRVSEVLGNDERYLSYDKRMRRMGMVYAAENMERAMLKDERSKEMCESYRDGVNAYIDALDEKSLPLEYKLLGYKPEHWTTLKTALFVKNMALTLAGGEDDIEHTNAKTLFGSNWMKVLYPEVDESLEPIVAKGTAFAAPGAVAVKPAIADSLYLNKNNGDSLAIFNLDKPDPNNGSNNWVVGGSKTKSGKPILCSDPHLNISLPSIWYEIQLNTPNFNAYGASFPGGPGVIIGFNDSCAFGFTNAGRDVKDYYEIEFKDRSKKEYKFNGSWTASQLKIDTIKVKGAADVYDTVAFTVFGPVMYDQSFSDGLTNGKSYACRWICHDESNELLMWWKLDRAKNLDDYNEAIKDFVCPAQNMAFACKRGDIAIWQQGRFPLRWKGQGAYMMPGFDSSFMWQGSIPQQENPHMVNPERGFLSSANQRPVDSTYPYYIPGGYITTRGIIINRLLTNMTGVNAKDMMDLQNNSHNMLAEMARPILLRNSTGASFDEKEQKLFAELSNWNLVNTPEAQAPSIFAEWWKTLKDTIWKDEFTKTNLPLSWPDDVTLVEVLNRDSNFAFIDNHQTPAKETLPQLVQAAFKKACANLATKEKLAWGAYKDSKFLHLLRLDALSRLHLNIGGGNHNINCMQQTHGPSWKMVVHLDSVTEAYGIYPGGQDGNPGSKFYDSYVNDYAAGKHYPLWVMRKEENNDKRVIGKIIFGQ